MELFVQIPIRLELLYEIFSSFVEADMAIDLVLGLGKGFRYGQAEGILRSFKIQQPWAGDGCFCRHWPPDGDLS
jgi:hypothetical protein